MLKPSSARPGMENGIAARTSTTDLRSDHARATNARSIRSPRAGASSPAPGKPERTRIAMQSLNKYLVREDARIIILLTPPFDKTTHDPGYIQGYLPGVRENGAQYTHAALWAVLATALQGDGDRAFELFQMLNPNHARGQSERGRYLQGRAVRRGGGRVYGERTSRARRVDVVHRLGELDVSRRPRIHTRVPAARRDAVHRAVHSSKLEGVHDRVSLGGLDVRNNRRKP